MITDAASIFDTGSIIDGKWVLIERIGKGGMGEVHRAHQLNLKRDVALKLISQEFLLDLEDNPEEVETLRARFQREVQVMAQVRHPNVLQIFDYGSVTPADDGAAPVEYIAMELIPGNTLRFTMSEEGFAGEDELIREWIETYFLPVLDGVEAIHALGIVHRDLKPENILMDGEVPKIADFGLSRSVQMRAVSNSWDVKGTWPYMAPEQFSEFRRAGVTADIYSLGKILYEAVAGTMDPKQLPFKTVGLEDPQSPLDRALDPVIRKATHEEKEARYQTVAEFRQAIRGLLQETGATPEIGTPQAGTPPTSPPNWVRITWIGVILAVVSVLGMAVYHLVGKSQKETAVVAPTAPPRTADAPQLASSKPLQGSQATLLAPNGRTLLRVTAAASEEVFYADPKLVTFHHFVEFLNATGEKLEVVDGVVQKGDEVWIYIGDGQNTAEPIWYNNGRFQLRSAEKAPDPVVRVTWQGARAYAAHYGLQLPTYAQWQILRELPDMAVPIDTGHPSPPPDGGHGHMMGTSQMPGATGAASTAATDAVASANKEWVLFSADGKTRGGVVSWLSDASREAPLRRHPWEGFSDVGFRTVLKAG